VSEQIAEYRISVSEEQLEDLQRRLRATRWPEAETVNDWSQGIPLRYTRELCDYWAEEYNWREREERLNRFPQFRTEIEGLGIHFIHVRSPHENARPLLLTHGWPGSVVEFQEVIPALVDPPSNGGDAADAFHVVCPSLPGYGFSDKPAASGWDVRKTADAWAELMARLGYPRYFAQGGDWGSFVTTRIGIQDPDHCAGIHLNFVIGTPDPEADGDLTEAEIGGLASGAQYFDQESGYMKQQSTRPQTLGYGLVDSPAAQAAWIVEKFFAWTDNQGHPEDVASRDVLLDNVMLYWLNGNGASSARMYWESSSEFTVQEDEIKVPSGCSIFPKEVFRPSRRWVERQYTNLVYWNELERGGHFAALECPETFVGELRACFGTMDNSERHGVLR